MCYDKLLTFLGTFGVSYLLFNKYPQIFIKKFYNLYPISKFDDYLEINIGKKILRPVCHKVEDDVFKIEARGVDIYGEHLIYTENKGSIVMGLPNSPSDIGFKRIIVEMHKRLLDKSSVEILYFNDNEKISLCVNSSKSENLNDELTLDHILDSDVSEY